MSHLFIFCFFSLILETDQKIARIYVGVCSSFLVSDHDFRSLSCFKFVFVYDVIKHSNLIILRVAVWFSQH